MIRKPKRGTQCAFWGDGSRADFRQLRSHMPVVGTARVAGSEWLAGINWFIVTQS